MPEDLLLFLLTRIQKMAVWKIITFVSKHVKMDQSQLTKYFALDVSVAVLAILANSLVQANHARSTKHIYSRLALSNVFFQTFTHLH